MKLPIPTICCIDDDRDILALYASCLGQDAAVTTFSSPLQALQYLKEAESPDVLVMDQSMPEMDGLSTLDSLRRSGVSSAVVLVTGFATKELAIRAMDHMTFAIVEKPIDQVYLRKIVRNAYLMHARDSIRDKLNASFRDLRDVFLEFADTVDRRLGWIESQLLEMDAMEDKHEPLFQLLREFRSTEQARRIVGKQNEEVERILLLEQQLIHGK